MGGTIFDGLSSLVSSVELEYDVSPSVLRCAREELAVAQDLVTAVLVARGMDDGELIEHVRCNVLDIAGFYSKETPWPMLSRLGGCPLTRSRTLMTF